MNKAKRTLLFSDPHSGLRSAQPRKVREILLTETYDLAICVGDLFNGNTDAWTDDDWALLGLMRSIPFVAVVGNHDYYLTPALGHLTAIPVCRYYVWQCGGLLNVAVHGHQWDSANRHPNPFANAVIWAFTKALSKGWVGFRAEALFDHYNVEWTREGTKVKAGVIQFAEQQARSAGWTGGIAGWAGHTHEACESAEGNLRYLNLGCVLADTRPSYALVDDQGPRLVYC